MNAGSVEGRWFVRRVVRLSTLLVVVAACGPSGVVTRPLRTRDGGTEAGAGLGPGGGAGGSGGPTGTGGTLGGSGGGSGGSPGGTGGRGGSGGVAGTGGTAGTGGRGGSGPPPSLDAGSPPPPTPDARPTPPPVDSAPRPTTDVSAGGPPVNCGAIPAWEPNGKYTDGTRVANGSPAKIYQCLPWPRSGWCPIGAYEPGKPGGPWMDAWMDVGPCP